jgi:sucrose phosphorylase
VIVIGAYPDSVGSLHGLSKIASLADFVRELVPKSAGLHVLPFYPSSGDAGFAPDDWFQVRGDLGDWADIERLCAERPVIIDGVYNHVGVRHRIARQFFDSPSVDGVLHAFPANASVTGPSSPRGMPVLRRHRLAGGEWDVWQTFSAASVDIRLDHPFVVDEIRRHLEFLAAKGTWAVRLDGCAYYGKAPGEEQFHHPDGRHHARTIAKAAIALGLRVVAQLDCDPQGAAYFTYADGYHVPAVDYAYSAMLVEALVSQNPRALMDHLRRTWNLPCDVIRPPRTHDGILLQSDMLPESSFESLVGQAQSNDLPLRVSNGEYYEINSSFPYICALGGSADDMWARLRMVVALTAVLPGWPYFYLPMLVGDIPEQRFQGDQDPRSLNRLPIATEGGMQMQRSPEVQRVRSLLSYLCDLHSAAAADHGHAEQSVDVLSDNGLCVKWPGARIEMLCNFSSQRSIPVSPYFQVSPVYSERVSPVAIDPLGFGFWATR